MGSIRSKHAAIIQEAKELAGISTAQCALCLRNESSLVDSHIIPSFVYSWVKDTSATGFLRSGLDGDARLQDGIKGPLLCQPCEDIFGKPEREFADSIFYPYVKEELDHAGVGRGRIRAVPYSSKLLEFTVGLHWRTMFLHLASRNTNPDSSPSGREKSHSICLEKINAWRSFLLGRNESSGPERHYFIPLQSLAGVTNPENLENFPSNSSLYVLRAVDTTTVAGRNSLASYVKLGPMVFWASLKPTEHKHLGPLRIRKAGSLPFVTSLHAADVASFIFQIRPREMQKHAPPSSKVFERARRSHEKNPERVLRSMTFEAMKADAEVQLRQLSANSRHDKQE